MNSEDWDKRYREKELVWSAGPNQFVVQEVEGLAVGRALDVACGEGRNAIWLQEQGWKVKAMDYSPVAIEKARTRSEELGLGIEWQVGDATTDIAGQYDLILLAYLHLPREQTKKCLDLAANALAPKGTILIIGHDIRNIAEGVGGPQAPGILYGPEELSGLLPGLSVKRAETIEREVKTETGSAIALDVLVRACRE